VIPDMPRPRPPYLISEKTRHGRLVWHVRQGKGPRIRIRATYGTPEFTAAYQAALAGNPAPDSPKFNAKTLGWLVERYRESATWAALSPATRLQRERILRGVVQSAGDEPTSRITRSVIQNGIARRSPAAGKHFLQSMRGLFQWAVVAKLADGDPTAELKAILPTTDGFHVWSEDECTAFEERWPRGTRERVAFDVLLYTGLRRGDAVRLGRPHVRKGIATIRTEKTGQLVTIPILPPLRETLDAGPVGELTFIAGGRGRPMKKESFGTWFRAACKAAGVPGSAHGLRKAGATRAANNGATEAQLEAMFGWRGGGMASLYTRQANRAKLALEAADKLLSEQDANRAIPAPRTKCGRQTRKTRVINTLFFLWRSRQDSNL
jgi:integrase